MKYLEMSAFQNTKDPVEQQFNVKITKYFPQYSVFWSKFIGDPKKESPTPYGLLFDKSIKSEDIRRIEDIYEEICMSHYSLFCHLAGAHFQKDNLNDALTKGKYFDYWEAFEVCYFHLGSAFYQMYHLWGLLFLLKAEVTRNSEGYFHPGVKSKLKGYLEGRGKTDLSTKIDELDEEIKDLRDNIVHYARTAARSIFGVPCIPRKIDQKTWKKQRESREWVKTPSKVQRDLKQTEVLINEIHIFLIEEFNDYLNTKGIIVNR